MERDQEIKYYIMNILADHVGYESRIPKKLLLRTLNQRTGYSVSDRAMRIALEELRTTKQGMWICATTRNRGGYFLAANPEELDAFTKSDLNRAYALLHRVQAQRKNAKLDTTPQIRMF